MGTTSPSTKKKSPSTLEQARKASGEPRLQAGEEWMVPLLKDGPKHKAQTLEQLRERAKQEGFD